MQIRIVSAEFHEASRIITPATFPSGNEAAILLYLLEDQCVLVIALERIFVFHMQYQHRV